MSAKKLDQSVFDGLPKEYRWAFVCPEGEGWIFVSEPKPLNSDFDEWDYRCKGKYKHLGSGYDTTNWQNSKIERQDVPTADIAAFREIPTKPAPQVDWNAAPEGAEYWCPDRRTWIKLNGATLNIWDGDGWALSGQHIKSFEVSKAMNCRRPKSLGDTRKDPVLEMVRSIEAARVAEKSMPYPDGDARYFETSEPSTLAEKRAQEMAEKLEAAQKDVYARCSSYRVAAYPHYFKDVSGVDAIDLYHVARLYDITDPALFHAFKKIACAGKRGAKDQAQDVQEAIDALKRWQELSK